MISVIGLSGGYGQVQVLHDVSFEVGSGRVVAVLGANGAGKTSLVRGLIGGLPSQTGTTQMDGKDIRPLTPARCLGLGIAHVPEGRGVFGEMTTYENLCVGARRAWSDLDKNLDSVFNIFPVLADRRRQRAGTLSGGEQQALAIARGLMSSPQYLLVDEPSLGLAPRLVADTFEFLRRISTEQQIGILLAEQNQLTVKFADDVLIISQGRILQRLDAQELTREELFELYLGGDR